MKIKIEENFARAVVLCCVFSTDINPLFKEKSDMFLTYCFSTITLNLIFCKLIGF